MPDIKNIEQIPIKPEQSTESTEQNIAPEKKSEQFTEKKAEVDTQSQSVVLPSDTQPEDQIVTDDTIVLKKVESILSNNMDKVFLEMDANTQQVFRVKGEETAKQITILLQKAKVKTKQIIDLIVTWLRIIPRVNKHYIEQEAKIKAELIMQMHKNK